VTFEDILKHIKAGKKVQRLKWAPFGGYIEMCTSYKGLCLRGAPGYGTICEPDIFAEDWQLVGETMPVESSTVFVTPATR
jgi:hypothetical protein